MKEKSPFSSRKMYQDIFDGSSEGEAQKEVFCILLRRELNFRTHSSCFSYFGHKFYFSVKKVSLSPN